MKKGQWGSGERKKEGDGREGRREGCGGKREEAG